MEIFVPIKILGENCEPITKIGIAEIENCEPFLKPDKIIFIDALTSEPVKKLEQCIAREPQTPRLRRYESISEQEKEQILFGNFIEGTVEDITPQKLKNKEFLHLQEEIMGLCYQAEVLHGRTLAKTTEFDTILKRVTEQLDLIEILLKLDSTKREQNKSNKNKI